ncbi:MAG: hypothetical protein IPP27_12920 [Bacteroidetes bacterium]|jgi:hypothetical protein|nr:hypothetical protein [Bacteroidota bacterium]MBK8365486.1 hypothetical protein [Bacteroidota bacterium]MBL0033020.1 hypothetical protein [Bacteroidota bacterium]MBP6476743.1 hypothetical protein [Chitinophagaceae bacterium]MBP7256741.1 hypothetical protein [Chitinophagales bacterium]
MIAVKTLTLLADKFQKDNIEGIRFFLSFQTPELGEFQDRENKFHEDGDQYFISERLSFHTRRENEEVISITQFMTTYSAILIIDI